MAASRSRTPDTASATWPRVTTGPLRRDREGVAGSARVGGAGDAGGSAAPDAAADDAADGLGSLDVASSPSLDAGSDELESLVVTISVSFQVRTYMTPLHIRPGNRIHAARSMP